MDRFDQLRVFVRVAELASFTRAADDLELSRAVVSQQVAALERRLGSRLFNRTTRRVSLTGDGASYLERARRVLAELEAADDSVRHARERPEGRLRVDVPTAFGRYLLAPALPAFQRQYPDLAVEVRLNDAIADFVADRVDVAVRVGRITAAGLVARRIAAMRLVTCASPAYLEREGEPRTIEDLRRHRCIGRQSPETGRMTEWSFLRAGARVRFRPSCALAFNLAEAVISAGIAGGGVLQTVDLMLGEPLASGRLRPVLAEYAAPGPAMQVVYAHADRQSAKVRVFADFAERVTRNWSARITRLETPA